MAFVDYIPELLELAVSDRALADTRIKQRACFINLRHVQQPGTRLCSAQIDVLVTPYSAQGDAFGPALSGPGIAPYMVTLTADNDTLVSVVDGAILAVRNRNLSEQEWQAQTAEIATAHEHDVMLQGNYFAWLRKNQPLLIDSLILHHIQAADAMGRFS